jgi:hypothetical protein
MKKILFLLMILSHAAYGQQVAIGTVFTIGLSRPEKSIQFTIISKNPYQGILDDSKIDSIFTKNKPAKDQITGVFAKGKFGSKVSTMLVLTSGLKDNLSYDLEIKASGRENFQNTSTSPLFKGVKSVEYWPYDIEKINFKAFKVIQAENLKIFRVEETVDSTCIKNADKNIEAGEQEFKSHLKSIILKFNSGDKFPLDSLLNYEKAINAADVSLGYFWSLAESIYPNKKRFKFGNPLSFRRVECPYFEDKVDYFYTKRGSDVKVVSFNWETFKQSNFGIGPEIKDGASKKFIEKYNFVVKAVSELLGEPLPIKQEENSGRVDTKWHSRNGISAYLFRFENYNEIRLYVYKK